LGVAIDDLQRVIREFADERDWGQFHNPKNLVMALTNEAGELTEIFQWLTAEQSAAVMSDPERATQVRDELADVLAYLLQLADVLDIDLAAAFTDKMAKNALKYPVDAARGRAAKYTELARPGAAPPAGRDADREL
jgi:NTP pyrophosphatase (non-canonical NTP hydrolase)